MYGKSAWVVVLERFKLYLSALPTAHKVLLLTEFKLGEGASVERYKQAAQQFHYHLLASPGSPTGGVAIMVHHSVARDPPKLEVVVPARLAYVSLNVPPHLSWLPSMGPRLEESGRFCRAL